MSNPVDPHVLVPVTGDHELDAALDYAAAEAMRRSCGVHLVHVQHPGYSGPPEVAELRLIDGELKKAAVDLLERAASHVEGLVDDTVTVSTELVHGVVVSALVTASKQACLVVMQKHRTGPLARISALSVTSGVAARAHAPVVVVPASWQHPGQHPGPVVVGVEEAPSAQVVVRAALDAARRTRSSLRLVQCWWISQAYDDIVFADHSGAEHSARLRKHLEADFAPLVAEYAVVEAEYVAAHAPPADALVKESHHASLVVVGRHHPSTPLGSHLGPIARTVLRESTCPVLVVEPRTAEAVT